MLGHSDTGSGGLKITSCLFFHLRNSMLHFISSSYIKDSLKSKVAAEEAVHVLNWANNLARLESPPNLHWYRQHWRVGGGYMY